MTTIRGFVSHAFADAAYEGGVDAFRDNIGKLVAAACADFNSADIAVGPELFFFGNEYGRPLMASIREEIRRSDFLIADITQPDSSTPVNPNVMYEIGFAMALMKRVIVMRRNAKPHPPADIADLLAGSYDSLDAIPQEFLPEMIDVVRDLLARGGTDSAREEFVRKVWFPSDTRSISIVCAREREPTRFSDSQEANYVHIDNFEDRDALLELSAFFGRRFPNANVVPYLDDEIPHAAKNGDLVVLGGPGCVAGEGNAVARDLLDMLDSKVHYPANGEGLIWQEEPIRSTEYEDGDDTKGVVSDWGSILAAPNPYNPGSRVVLLHGTTTYGTLGAAIALIDTRIALRNHLGLASLDLVDRLTGTMNFEVLVRAEVDSGRRLKPTVLDFDTVRRVDA